MNWAELRAFATLLCRSQRGRKVRTFNAYLRIKQESEPGTQDSFDRQRARLVLASEPGALTRNSYRFAGEGLTKSGSVRTRITTPRGLPEDAEVPFSPSMEYEGSRHPMETKT